MRRRLAGAILLLYPRRVRRGHGPEMVALIEDLIAREGRSPAGLFLRLTLDGLFQRLASAATVWTVAAILAATGLGGLAVSGLAAASAIQRRPRRVGTLHADRASPRGPCHATPIGRAERLASRCPRP